MSDSIILLHIRVAQEIADCETDFLERSIILNWIFSLSCTNDSCLHSHCGYAELVLD